MNRGHWGRAGGDVRRQAAEQALHLVLQASGEEDRIGIARRSANAGNQLPPVRDHDLIAARVSQLDGELAVLLQIVRIDGAVAEVAYQQIAGERTEARRRDVKPPGSVERIVRIVRIARRHALQQVPLEIELIHEAVAGTGKVDMLHVVLHRKRHKQLVAENLDVERSEARGKVGVGEALHLIKVLVEHVNRAVAEVRRA
jgi:hypothetical protein